MRQVGLALLFACTPAQDGPGTGPPSHETPPPTTEPTAFATSGTAQQPEVTLGPERRCVDPAPRAERHFDRHLVPGPAATAVNIVGSGIAAADFDGDGWIDLVFAGEDASVAWRGTGDPVTPFEATTWLDGLDTAMAVSAFSVDLDADGALELVVGRWGVPNVVLSWTGSGFADVTPAAFTATSRTVSGTAADLDRDGDLDLFFGAYGSRPQQTTEPYIPPADPAELYRNDGGTWTDLSASLPQQVHDGYVFQIGFYDIDGDDLPEGFVANDFGDFRPSILLRNLGAMAFEADETWHAGADDMGLGVGDVNGDSVPDFLISSIGDTYVLASGEALGLPGLWIETGADWFLRSYPTTKLQHFGWASEWADLDQDGLLDGVMTFGHWDEWFTSVGQQDAFWRQESGSPPVFAEVAGDPVWGLNDDGPGRGMALADLNGDGWLDLAKRELGSDTVVHLSRCGSANWVEVALVGPPDNPGAIGARIAVQAGGRTQTRWVDAGGHSLFSGAPPLAHFGLGEVDEVDAIRVHWPDGSDTVTGAVPALRRATIRWTP